MPKYVLSSILLIILVISFVESYESKNKTSEKVQSTGMHHTSGTISKVGDHRVVVRVGDATKSYSFDNRTVFTSGDQSSDPSSLKIGDEIVVSAVKDNAVEINGTKRIEGIVESIDIDDEILTVKVGQETKKYPFSYFRISKMDGKPASVLDMKPGDSVFIKVNMGFSKASSNKKQRVTKQ